MHKKRNKQEITLEEIWRCEGNPWGKPKTSKLQSSILHSSVLHSICIALQCIAELVHDEISILAGYLTGPNFAMRTRG